MRTKLLGTAAAIGLFVAGAAQALPVSISMEEIAGVTTGPTVVAGPANGSANFTSAFGDFAINGVMGIGTLGTAGPQPQPQLNGSTVNVTATCDNCELIVKISETGLTFPETFASYTTNYDWLVKTGNSGNTFFSAYISNTNTAFGDNVAIGSVFEANAPTAVVTAGILVGGIASTFAETLEYDMFFGNCTVAGGAPPQVGCTSSLQSEISATQAVPEPASLSLLGAALIGFGAWRRRKAA